MTGIRNTVAVALTVFAVSPADAITILARCGPSSGQSYFFEGGVTGPGQGGWKPDGFKGGRITALLNSENKLDIVMKDASGLTSYISQGYKVELITI